MTISSMTGFARVDDICAGYRAHIEIKAVNGRGLDVRARVPSILDGFDLVLKKRARSHLHRGNVSVTLTLAHDDAESSLQINEDRLSRLIALSQKMSGDTGLVTHLDGLLALPGVLGSSQPGLDEDSRQELEASLLELIDKAFDKLNKSRSLEGESLGGHLHSLIDEIARLTERAGQMAEAQPAMIRDRIAVRLSALLDKKDLDPDRLEQEVALLALKHDIREELDRLTAHIQQARTLLSDPGPKGRRLEFLSQEFNREANTLCAKSAGTELTRIGLDLKATIDQFREQILNVE